MNKQITRKRILCCILALMLLFASGCAAKTADQAKADGSEGFVLLAEAVPDVIQEIRYYSTYNFVGERIDGYEQPCALITKEAAEALKAVSDDVMAQGYRLKVFDAYRPQMAVDHFVRWAEDLNATEMKPYFYPEVDKSLSMLELSRRSGISQPQISMLESGKYQLKRKAGEKLAAVLEVGVDWLLTGDEDRKDFPADKAMVNWLWQHPEVREELWKQMKEKSN